MSSTPVRIGAITSNASLVVALTLRVEDWDIVSGPTASAVDQLESSDVLLIDRGSTELGLAELEDARLNCPLAPAIIIGDEESDQVGDATLLLRPFTLEDLARAINDAGNSAAAPEVAPPAEPEPPPVAIEEEEEDLEEPEMGVFDEDDFDLDEPPVVVTPEPDDEWEEPEPVVVDEAPAADAPVAPPPRAAVQETPAADVAADEEDFVEPEPVVLADETASDDLDEPAPMVAAIEPSTSLIIDDDEEDEDPLEELVEQAVEARRAPDATPEPPQPAAPVAKPEPAKPTPPVPTPPAPADRRRRGWRKKKRPEDEQGPAEIAAQQMAVAAASSKGRPRELRGRVADILVAGSDLHALIDEMPILRSGADLADVLAGEVQDELHADTVAVWLLEGDHFVVGGGRGLTTAESRTKAPLNQPLLADLQRTGAASLITPVDLAAAIVSGIAGARTKALMATAIAIGPDRYAHITVGASDYTEEDLDRLVELAVEAAPFFAIARLMDGLRAR
ncbi:MAG: hypothetical protein R3249_00025 [Nitriliruptorales bacterium]|nr:hypothetical protein [Nitriliruptorales bacterium]